MGLIGSRSHVGMAELAWVPRRYATDAPPPDPDSNSYDPTHFDNPTMDQVRQRENLDNALSLLQRATQIDPANPTARQRLAAIALSRGEYVAALGHIQVAWDAGHRDPITRLLLGDAYVANGRVEEAVEVVPGLHWAGARLVHQAWLRYWLSQDYARAADAWAAAVLLDPSDRASARLQRLASEAARRAGQ
jgi:tetratricopeptide (TPR) repeat protein